MRYLLNWFRRGTLERDLDRELAYHTDLRVSDLMDAGLPEPEARRRVALELGGATQVREEVRDVWLTRWLRDLVYDLRFSARAFRRDRSFTLTAVLSLLFFGGEVLKGFSIAMLWGIVIGTYSSLFIAAPIIYYIQPRRRAAGREAGDSEPARPEQRPRGAKG